MANNNNGLGTSPSGSGGFFCEDCQNKVPHALCRYKPRQQSPNAFGQKPAYSQRELPPMGHDFPRRGTSITPDETLIDLSRILGGPESSYTRSTTGETILHQPRLESTAYTEKENFNPSPYRILEPLLEKLRHLYPRNDSEIVFSNGVGEVGPSTTLSILDFETTAQAITYFRHMQVTVFDGLIPSKIGVQIKVDGTPIKIVVQTNKIVGAPVYGTEPTTSGFIDPVCMPIFQNGLFTVADRKPVSVVIKNNDTIATRKVAVSLWGYTQPFSNFGRSTG